MRGKSDGGQQGVKMCSVKDESREQEEVRVLG